MIIGVGGQWNPHPNGPVVDEIVDKFINAVSEVYRIPRIYLLPMDAEKMRIYNKSVKDNEKKPAK